MPKGKTDGRKRGSSVNGIGPSSLRFQRFQELKVLSLSSFQSSCWLMISSFLFPAVPSFILLGAYHDPGAVTLVPLESSSDPCWVKFQRSMYSPSIVSIVHQNSIVSHEIFHDTPILYHREWLVNRLFAMAKCYIEGTKWCPEMLVGLFTVPMDISIHIHILCIYIYICTIHH